jgi:hypothetical protein
MIVNIEIQILDDGNTPEPLGNIVKAQAGHGA